MVDKAPILLLFIQFLANYCYYFVNKTKKLFKLSVLLLVDFFCVLINTLMKKHHAVFLQDASYVMCLDTLALSDSLYMHVSKPPKEGSAASVFFKELRAAADKFPSMTVDGVHKKINLAEDLLAWEHERFSIRRLPGFTLSSVNSYKDSFRGTILDTRENLNLERLVRNTKVVAEALACYVYNISGGVFDGSLVSFLFLSIEFRLLK